jgi:hypothetical protein
MVRSETFPFRAWPDATPGQFTWVVLNQRIDYEERRARVHLACRSDFDRELCEVCHKPLTGAQGVPEEFQDQVYRPGDVLEEYADEIYRPGEEDRNGRVEIEVS